MRTSLAAPGVTLPGNDRMDSALIVARGITKQFPGVVALREVTLSLNRGEVLAVIGENGAGKSTLMNILAGVHAPDAGHIAIYGEEMAISSPRHAMDLGISLIHQELSLLPNLSVGANMFLGREPHVAGYIRGRQIAQDAEAILARIGLEVSPDTPVSRLSIGHRQLVEIARALSAEARILIMDEPTSSLSLAEAETLFEVITELRARGVSIVYVSHRLGEVQALADRVVVLRDGEAVGELVGNAIQRNAMVRLMVGRDVSYAYRESPATPGDAVLEAHDLCTPAWPEYPLTLTLREGEIVGLAGLVGSGRTELLRVLFGVDPATSGSITICGAPVSLLNPRDAIAAGIALVPEDRGHQGLILEMSVRHNLTLSTLWREGHSWGWLRREWEAQVAADQIQNLGIKASTDARAVRVLSGGNQQKVVVGKWLQLRPRLLLLDEPTRGIDVGAKEEIYRVMETLAQEGMAILFASSELEEILGLADRVLVMHEGRLTGELSRDDLSEEAIMHLATGQGVGATNPQA